MLRLARRSVITGALLVTADRATHIIAHAVRTVDCTGAGDTFAAGFMGYLAREGVLSRGALRQAVIHGNVLASFTVEDFSIDRLRTLTPAEVRERYDEFRYLTHFESLTPVEVECFQRPVE